MKRNVFLNKTNLEQVQLLTIFEPQNDLKEANDTIIELLKN